MRKYILIFLSACILIALVSLVIEDSKKEKINILQGSFTMEQNENNWISFNKDGNIHYYAFVEGTQIEYKGFFEYIEPNEYRITDGVFKDHNVEVHKKYIIIKNDSLNIKFIKFADFPGRIERLE